MSPPPDPALPARYAFRRELGRGGFGEVLLVHDEELGREVAFKRLHERLDDPRLRRRFEREARLTAGLEHPHVVRVFDSGLDARDRPYIVFEFVEGEDLGERIRRGVRTPLEKVATWGHQIADALAAAHAAGVVHRDVKPENILVRADGHPLLADLGIARSSTFESSLTSDGEILGTPALMAPELWRGHTATAASDQFAWAASLFELAYGRPAWGQGSLAEITERALRGAEPAPTPTERDRDPGLAAALTRALRREPEKRFPSMQAFARALAAGAPGDGSTRVVARPTSRPGEAPPPPSTPAPRRPSPPIPGVLAALVLLAATLAFVAAPADAPAAGPPPTPPASPTATAPDLAEVTERLRILGATLAGDHRQPHGGFEGGTSHLAHHLEDILDPAKPLRWSRWLAAVHDWLAAHRAAGTAPEEFHSGPRAGPRYLFFRDHVLELGYHFLDDLAELDRRYGDPIGFTPFPAGRNPYEVHATVTARLKEVQTRTDDFLRRIAEEEGTLAFPATLLRGAFSSRYRGDLRGDALDAISRELLTVTTPSAAYDLGVARNRILSRVDEFDVLPAEPARRCVVTSASVYRARGATWPEGVVTGFLGMLLVDAIEFTSSTEDATRLASDRPLLEEVLGHVEAAAARFPGTMGGAARSALSRLSKKVRGLAGEVEPLAARLRAVAALEGTP